MSVACQAMSDASCEMWHTFDVKHAEWQLQRQIACRNAVQGLRWSGTMGRRGGRGGARAGQFVSYKRTSCSDYIIEAESPS